jgi:hypothetical protein
MLADGGNIYRGGAAIVGEAGPELLNLPRGASVTPLSNDMADTVAQAVYQAIRDAMQLSRPQNAGTPQGDVYLDNARVGRVLWSILESEVQRRGGKLIVQGV